MHGPTAGSITILVDPANTGKTDLCTLIQTLNPGAAVPVHHSAGVSRGISVHEPALRADPAGNREDRRAARHPHLR